MNEVRDGEGNSERKRSRTKDGNTNKRTRDGPNHITAPGKQTFRNLTPRHQQHTILAEAAQTTPWSPGSTIQMEMD